MTFFFQAPPAKAVKKATPAKPPVKNGTNAKKAESEDDDSGKQKTMFSWNS